MIAIDCSRYTDGLGKEGKWVKARDVGKLPVLIALFSHGSDNGKEKLFPPVDVGA